MSALGRELLGGREDSPVRLVYGTATAKNTVRVDGEATAVVLPAISSVRSGDRVAVLKAGGDRLIVGPVGGGEWKTDWGGGLSTTNLALGNGTITVRHQIDDGTVNFELVWDMGSTSTVGTGPTFSLPVPAASTIAGLAIIGTAYIRAGGIQFFGAVQMTSTTVMRPLVLAAGGTYATISALSATVPGTFATGDDIILTGSYQAA